MGVAFEGAVFPIINGRRIDVSGRWFYPNECPVLLEAPTEWNEVAAFEPPFRWQYDARGYYAYVFLDGDEGLRGAAIAALENAGLFVSRSGESFRDGPDGEVYRWFLRLEAEGEVKPSRWEIAQALARASSLAAGTSAARADPAWVPTQDPDQPIRGETTQLGEWQIRVSSAEREAVRLEEELATARSELEKVRDLATREQARLVDQVALLRAALEEYKFQGDGFTERDRDIAEETAADKLGVRGGS